jgi:integrase/recombinase XerD
MAPKKLPRILTDAQARALLALPNRRYPTGRRNRALLAMLYMPTCLRIAEALALKLRDVDLAAGVVNVRRGKGARDRTCYLDDMTREHLRAWLEVRPQGAETLLCTLKGGTLDTSYARHLLARLGEKLGLEWRLHPHTLRHSGASELLRRGFTLADVQRVLGHANAATTSIYLHVFDSDLAAKVQALGREGALVNVL